MFVLKKSSFFQILQQNYSNYFRLLYIEDLLLWFMLRSFRIEIQSSLLVDIMAPLNEKRDFCEKLWCLGNQQWRNESQNEEYIRNRHEKVYLEMSVWPFFIHFWTIIFSNPVHWIYTQNTFSIFKTCALRTKTFVRNQFCWTFTSVRILSSQSLKTEEKTILDDLRALGRPESALLKI